ncbi:MAG TPA: primosomal protein N' [Burkholderiaceae bacterium]|nr:primosomal protein N' [Burkholderiaceae bacterium]
MNLGLSEHSLADRIDHPDEAFPVSDTRSDRFARVALDVPLAQLGASLFDYRVPAEMAAAVAVGSWVVVPWGRGRRVGLVAGLARHCEIDAARVRPLSTVLGDAPALPPSWFELLRFCADYYHRGLGEVALPAIPKLLRTPPAARARGSVFARARERFATALPAQPASQPPPLNEAQRAALEALLAIDGFAVHLLHGITGSGKTEVYLHWLERMLARDERGQVLLLVPEIALTPQLAAQVAARFPAHRVAVLHSDLADGERAAHWLAAVEGRARVVIGTRLAVLAPLPALAAIVVDEEHDASYKQQEGVRYSARDLAIVAASQRRVPIVLGSATPSLESWHAARRGRYRLLALPERVGGAQLPALERIDLRGRTLRHQLAQEAIDAIEAALARGEQALVFINRRGYAPVLACESCGWLSRCSECSAYRVLHRVGAPRPARYRLICHHCGAEQQVPRVCPDCGNVDLAALGRGTQRLEEGLAELFPGRRIARLDRDVARTRGAAQKVIDAAHAGDVDILVGTQMLAKGHDFRRLTVVVAVDGDGGLFSSDFRAPERMFATLMQVAGRAGRDPQCGADRPGAGNASECADAGDGAAPRGLVIVQTRFPEHPLFEYLARHDYAGFADAQLAERREVGLPPWRFQALLRADAATQADALAFLAQARRLGESLLSPASPEGLERASADALRDGAVALLDPVPMAMSRLAGRERAQLLVEARARPPLHAFLRQWLPMLREPGSQVRWQLDVDPLEI